MVCKLRLIFEGPVSVCSSLKSRVEGLHFPANLEKFTDYSLGFQHENIQENGGWVVVGRSDGIASMG